MIRVFYGYECQPPIVNEVPMLPDTDRPRRKHNMDDDARDMQRRFGTPGIPVPYTAVPRPIAILDEELARGEEFLTDVRVLLDYMDGEYVGPELARTLHRLRSTVGQR